MSFQRVWFGPIATVALACGASADVVSLPDEPRDAAAERSRGQDASDASLATPIEASEPSVDAPTEAACDACVNASVSWGRDGGLVISTEASSLTDCNAYTHERRERGADAPTESCTEDFVSCDTGGRLSPGLIARALQDPYVLTALASAPVLYGGDPRPVDGSVFRMVIDGKTIEIGTCAVNDEECVPPGVASLANLLRSIDDEMLTRGSCRDAFGAD